jgi:hypothetical protein
LSEPRNISAGEIRLFSRSSAERAKPLAGTFFIVEENHAAVRGLKRLTPALYPLGLRGMDPKKGKMEQRPIGP